MSGDFVPIIRKEDYDEYAHEILDKFYFIFHPEARVVPMAINTDELARNMGLNVINASITKDRSIFGQIFFSDTEVNLYDSTSGKIVKRKVSKNSIIVDDEACILKIIWIKKYDDCS